MEYRDRECESERECERDQKVEDRGRKNGIQIITQKKDTKLLPSIL